ncbi:MAG TPA: amino acid ABC transporter ATP-binding protein [Acidimicrobiales bacterium]|nr:amino acid ABC transporter ATP-binding protein [Acidimicrobiales bacterium]
MTTLPTPSSASDGETPAMIVQAIDIKKSFGSQEVLKGVSLEVRRGEVVVLIGPSGSGKTTFLRCINHFEKPNSGAVHVNGHLIGSKLDRNGERKDASAREVAGQRAEIGFVFQHFNLFPNRTAIENVMLGPMKVQKKSKEAARALAIEQLTKVGLSNKVDAYPAQLSGGQKQRVAIARSLAMNPALMLFDEPTSALDPEVIGEVLTVIRDLANEGMTMIIVSHEIGFAREVADRVAMFDDGQIVEIGLPQQVFDSPVQARTQAFLSKVL